MGVHERLAELLGRVGITQSEMGRRIGESPSWVNDRLEGRTQVNADDLPRLAAALGVSPCAFFEEAAPSGVGAAVEAAVERAAGLAARQAAAEVGHRLLAELDRRGIGEAEGFRPGIVDEGTRELVGIYQGATPEERERLMEIAREMRRWRKEDE